jgi:hypothetical protein
MEAHERAGWGTPAQPPALLLPCRRARCWGRERARVRGCCAELGEEREGVIENHDLSRPRDFSQRWARAGQL